MSKAEQEKPFFRVLTEEDSSMFAEIEKDWGRYLRSGAKPAETRGRGLEHRMMEEVCKYLGSAEGKALVSKKVRSLMDGKDIRLKEYGIHTVSGYYVPIEVLFPGTPGGYLLIISGEESEEIIVGRHIGTDDPVEIDMTIRPDVDLDERLKAVAQQEKFRQILFHDTPASGEPVSLMIEFDGRTLKVVVLEVLTGDQIANENPMAAYAIHKGLMDAINQARK